MLADFGRGSRDLGAEYKIGLGAGSAAGIVAAFGSGADFETDVVFGAGADVEVDVFGTGADVEVGTCVGDAFVGALGDADFAVERGKGSALRAPPCWLGPPSGIGGTGDGGATHGTGPASGHWLGTTRPGWAPWHIRQTCAWGHFEGSPHAHILP